MYSLLFMPYTAEQTNLVKENYGYQIQLHFGHYFIVLPYKRRRSRNGV